MPHIPMNPQVPFHVTFAFPLGLPSSMNPKVDQEGGPTPGDNAGLLRLLHFDNWFASLHRQPRWHLDHDAFHDSGIFPRKKCLVLWNRIPTLNPEPKCLLSHTRFKGPLPRPRPLCTTWGSLADYKKIQFFGFLRGSWKVYPRNGGELRDLIGRCRDAKGCRNFDQRLLSGSS